MSVFRVLLSVIFPPLAVLDMVRVGPDCDIAHLCRLDPGCDWGTGDPEQGSRGTVLPLSVLSDLPDQQLS